MPDEKKVKAAKPAEKLSKKTVNRVNRVAGIKHFLIDTKAEFKKIVWPTSRQVLNNTIVVIVMILVVGTLIWCLDAATSSALSFFYGKYA
jgi:preprotein translocase subunit SecE